MPRLTAAQRRAAARRRANRRAASSRANQNSRQNMSAAARRYRTSLRVGSARKRATPAKATRRRPTRRK